jgi:hypothetical protein
VAGYFPVIVRFPEYISANPLVKHEISKRTNASS